nr:hypothetical protein [Tanacetum cinerariifolium]
MPPRKSTRGNPPPPLTQDTVNRMIQEIVEAAIWAERERVQNEANRAKGPNVAPVARECTFADFMKCSPITFQGNKGAVGLIRWIEKTKMVFTVSKCTEANKVVFAAATIQDRALTWWNSQVATSGIEVVEAYIRGLSKNIKGEVTSSEPATLSKAVRMAYTLMEQKVKAKTKREADNKKRKWESFQGGSSNGGGNNNSNRNNNNYNSNRNYNNNCNNNQNQYRNPNRNHQNNQRQGNARAMTNVGNQNTNDTGQNIKCNSGNEDGNTACVPTVSTNVPTASASVATISQDTACAYIASQSSGSQIKFEDINQIDEDNIEEMDIKWNMALLSMRADKAPRNQDRGRRDNYKQGSKAEEQAPKALMEIDGVGWDWSYMANDEEDHALVAPTEVALMANTSAESKVFDNSLCSKDCKKNNDSLNSKITDLTDKFFDANNLIYHYKFALAQVESRLDKIKDGLGYSAVPPPPAQLYLSPNKDLSWTSLPECSDDTVTDYSRPSPTIESTSGDDQNRNPSVYKTAASPITPKPFIKFMKPKDSQSKSKLEKGRNFPTANRKFPTVSRKFPTVSTKCSTADMGMKGKAGSSHNNIDDKGYWDSGCSRHMTENISYHSDCEPFDGGYVSFSQGGCKITRKGTIKTGRDKMGGHGRSGVRADWSDDDYITY